MIQDLHTEIDRLKRRIKLCERVTLGSLVGICVSVKFGHQEWIGLLFLILFCQISKLVFKRKLKQKEYLVKGRGAYAGDPFGERRDPRGIREIGGGLESLG